MSGIRLLVVDDNVDAAETLRALLEIDRHQVFVAYGGDVALTMLADHVPHLAFLDIGLPDINGFALARLIRSFGRPIYLVAVSGWSQPQDVAKALASGFDEHVAKPASYADISRIAAQVKAAFEEGLERRAR